jgi:hypothetical protein
MEVEISSGLFNCSVNRVAAMVANDFHLILRTFEVSGCRGHALLALSRRMPKPAVSFLGFLRKENREYVQAEGSI